MTPYTIRNLEATGVSEGWRCLEVGAGAGSVARFLSVVVGPTGSVVALGLRTTFLDEVRDLPNVKIVESNIVHDPVPEEAFDLIHARWTLIWIPERDQVLAKLLAALRPGGWIVLEESFAEIRRVPLDPDFPGAAHFESLYDWLNNEGLERLGFGAVSTWTRALPSTLHRRGLTAITGYVDIPLIAGATPRATFMKLTLGGLMPAAVAAGQATEIEAQEMLNMFDKAEFYTTGTPTLVVRGQRPGPT